ncbi:MAG: BMP family ABC transporter substrate-binding protein, partial [Candidatus Bathyarchaeota archaeon]|nr:BMP family ABC transporter substrate-binding protein [Candidatus Bathyarchaeota archaeon]
MVRLKDIKGIARTTAILIAVIVIIVAAVGVYLSYSLLAPSAPEFKIAVVSDIGGRGDLSFNDMAFKGGEEAEEKFNVNMSEIISKVEADYVPNLELGAKDPDVKLIVGVGYLLEIALADVARRYPHKNFVGIDTSAQSQVLKNHPDEYPLPNLMDIVYEEHKGSALV